MNRKIKILFLQGKIIAATLFILCLSKIVSSQNTAGYFQQEVNYTIHVTLDDTHQFLRGNISIQYTNHSPDTLRFIYFHLWPNAYKNNSTAFAKQLLENGNTSFNDAKDSDHGFIDSLNFTVNSENAKLEIDSINIDIAKLYLPAPLAPGESISIASTFREKLPYTFSRGGHVGQQYQISQWYPKPAVYDRYGWHTMPYLDQGEFYSEFGSFDVEITLPENYVVGATGILQTKSEAQWMNEKASALNIDSVVRSQKKFSGKEIAKQLKTFPPSDHELKTLHFTAENVHDFAWFADKRYEVMKSSVKLPSGKLVTTWSLFLPQHAAIWKDAVTYADSGLWYYSKWVGDYPYDVGTVVDGALSAGGGMEYPMITVISEVRLDKELDETVAHELGHNWFYGALGFNEREHPWMDEGINSYYEYRYAQARYPDRKLLPDEDRAVTKTFDLNYQYAYQNYLFYLYSAAQRNDQPPDLHSALFTPLNYAAMVYAKTPIVMQYLASSVGLNYYDSIMHQFYQQWQFRHPYPVDLKNFFEAATHKELDWFFNQLIPTTDYLDYKLVKEDVGLKIGTTDYAQFVVKNTQQVKGPYSIAAFKDGKKVNEIFYDGFNGKMTVEFPDGNYDYFKIDPEFNLPELNRNNNYLRRKGILKKTEPLRLQWLASVDNPNRTQLFFTPVPGFNYYDGLSPGLALYNSVFFPKKINVLLVPQYGIKSKNFVGLGAVSVPFYLKNSFLHSITFTSAAKSYTFGNPSLGSEEKQFDQRYMRFTQWLTFDVKKKEARSSIDQKIIYRNIFLRQQSLTGVDPSVASLPYGNSMFNIISYSYSDRRVINPFELKTSAEFGNLSDDNYVKVFGEGNFIVTYPRHRTGLDIRFFGGVFLNSPTTSNYKFRLSSTTGLDDYLFDDIFLGRSETQGFFAQQISVADDGGFKMRTNGVSPRIGESSKWILSMNLKVPMPFFTPLFVFADGGLSPQDESNSFAGYDAFQYDAGVGLTIIPKIIEVYYPAFYSQDIKNNLINTDFYKHWYQRITFTFNIEKLNPFNLARNIQLR